MSKVRIHRCLGFFLQAGASAADVEEALTLPASPRLILVGMFSKYIVSNATRVITINLSLYFIGNI